MPSRTITNYYAILGISHNASLKDINSAYKKLALKYHPDKKTATTSDGPSSDEFQKIQQAIETLRDPILKQSHDDNLRFNGYRFSDFPDDDYNDEDYPSGTTWRPTQANRYGTRNPRERYMYSYGHSVHMDPFSADSLAEKARVQVEIRVGEMLKKEAEMREAAEAAAAAAAAASEEKGEAEAEGDYDEEYEEWIGFDLDDRPQAYEEFMEFLRNEEEEKAERRRAAMRANVERDEERLKRDEEDEGEEDEVLKDFARGYDFGCCWRSKEAGLSVPREYHEGFYSDDEDGQGVYWDGYDVDEDDDSDSDADDEEEAKEPPNPNKKDENNDDDEDNGEPPLDPSTTDQPPDTYYHSDHDSYSYYDDSDEYDDEGNDCADLYSYDDAADTPSDERSSTEYLTAQASEDSQIKSNVSTSGGGSSIFYDFSEDFTSISFPDEAPKKSTPGVNLALAPDYLAPFIPHFKNKLAHPSGRYTAQDFLTEVTGMILEIYCGWLESVRLTMPEAKPLQRGQDPQHCLHLGCWEKHFNKASCEECQLWKPIYTLTCPGCGIEACVGCKFSGCCVR
ncbi:DnaJ-domain-containing protein [Aspergillus sclerotiicarbonarius CBS 121057]|uniref:DnaJ-domain-containing protein n=1 Tax=Aspergillus sclerotiicarbonarius (strain CBS 121057 / IBT 28362) TaxID=1448318 RepID=A0A319EAE3_ASPSB|nr:DnaJ-domain-containing protein [Aspergillus sclerotiicarbonarius CBS 121057]